MRPVNRCQRDQPGSAADHEHEHEHEHDGGRTRPLDDHSDGRQHGQRSDNVAPVATSLGPLRFDLPADAVIDPRRRSPLPEFVAANQRWIVPGTVNPSVTIETIIPPKPADELIDEFDANGLTWHVFDSGPRNGALVIAITTIDTMSVLISAQSWTWDPTDVPRGYVDDLARTVQYQAP